MRSFGKAPLWEQGMKVQKVKTTSEAAGVVGGTLHQSGGNQFRIRGRRSSQGRLENKSGDCRSSGCQTDVFRVEPQGGWNYRGPYCREQQTINVSDADKCYSTGL